MAELSLVNLWCDTGDLVRSQVLEVDGVGFAGDHERFNEVGDVGISGVSTSGVNAVGVGVRRVSIVDSVV